MGGSVGSSDASNSGQSSGSGGMWNQSGQGYGGESNQGQSSNFGQDVWGALNQVAPGFFQQASNLWNNNMGAMNNFNQASNAAAGWGGNFANNALDPWNQQAQGGYAGGVNDGTQQSLIDSLNRSLDSGNQSKSSMMYEDIIGGAGNTYADPLADKMAQDSQVNMERNIMPSIRGSASDMGQSGSSRHGIAEGLAASDEARNLSGRQTEMRERNYDRDMNWKMNIANQADQQLGASQDRALGLVNSMNQSQQGALNNAGSIQNLGFNALAPMAQAMNMPFEQFSSLMGSIGISNPAVLSSGGSQGWGNEQQGGWGNSSGAGWMNQNMNQSGDQSASQFGAGK